MSRHFPLGKLPPEVLADLIAGLPTQDPRILVGPRLGEDAAVLDLGGEELLIAKTDPITFATDRIGWYAVHVNANDIAASGGTPAFFMASILLPELKADQAMATEIFSQIAQACRALNISLIGGHTEITFGIDRPIVSGTMLGTAPRGGLIHTGGAQPGDRLIVTKGVPVEATAIIAAERCDLFMPVLGAEFLARCMAYLDDPGISVVKDAAVAMAAGRVHAMHDPTEGGIATGLWEMAEAGGNTLRVDLSKIVFSASARLCAAAGIDPLGALASGALLLAAHADDVEAICAALECASVPAFLIGSVEAGPALVFDQHSGLLISRPTRDEITRLFE